MAGNPAIIVGTTDHAKQFHPFGLGLCYGETSSDFEFCFRACKKFKHDYEPNVLIADNAEAITNGFEAAYLPIDMKRINCWAHVYRKVLERSSYIKDKELKDQLLGDIRALQMSPTPQIFKKASELLKTKYLSISDAELFMD